MIAYSPLMIDTFPTDLSLLYLMNIIIIIIIIIIINFWLRNSEMDAYRLREPPNQNESITNKI
jgi:hypothetical protein